MKIINPNAVKAYFTTFKDCDCSLKFPEWEYGDACKCGSGIQRQYELEPNQTVELPEFSTGITVETKSEILVKPDSIKYR